MNYAQQGHSGIERMATLPDGWAEECGQKAPVISAAAILTAHKVQAALAAMWAVPTVQGGVQLELHAHHFDLEIEIDAYGNVDTVYANMRPALPSAEDPIGPQGDRE